MQKAGKWRKEELWVYPQPENVGLTLDVDLGHLVAKVADGSAAARLGFRPGDRITRVGDVPAVSIADVQYGLQCAPPSGEVAVTWLHDGREHAGRLTLAEGWRKTDISWRWSLRGLDPPPWVHGEDLSAERRRRRSSSANGDWRCARGRS